MIREQYFSKSPLLSDSKPLFNYQQSGNNYLYSQVHSLKVKLQSQNGTKVRSYYFRNRIQ